MKRYRTDSGEHLHYNKNNLSASLSVNLSLTFVESKRLFLVDYHGLRTCQNKMRRADFITWFILRFKHDSQLEKVFSIPRK